MRKKSGLIILILIMVLQLCVPAGMIIYKITERNTIIKNGLYVKIELESFTYSNGKLLLDTPLPDDGWDMLYAELENVSTTDFYKLQLVADKPAHDFYIKSSQESYFELPVNKIKVDNFENIDYIHFLKISEDDDWWDKIFFKKFKRAYLEAYVYQGKVYPKAVYIDSKEANEYLAKINEDKQ